MKCSVCSNKNVYCKTLCKFCYHRQWRKNNVESVIASKKKFLHNKPAYFSSKRIEYLKTYGSSYFALVQLKCRNKQKKDNPLLYRNKRKEALQLDRLRHPLEYKARRAVEKAVITREILSIKSQQCKLCSKQAQEYHHVNGYDEKNMLNVDPFCCVCHKRVDVAEKWSEELNNRVTS